MIELNDVSKLFRYKGNVIKAVDKVNLSVDRNEMVAIMGPSGSGKTTLLNIIGGIYSPTKGEYFFNNNLVSGSETEMAQFRNRNIGFILQDLALIKRKDIMYNISLPLIYARMNKEVIRKKVTDISKYLGIYDKLDMYPHMLSGGECQRAAIARAIINNPKVILADEPTSSLDSDMKSEIMSLLTDLNKKGITIIIATHDEYVSNICNRIIRINKGVIR